MKRTQTPSGISTGVGAVGNDDGNAHVAVHNLSPSLSARARVFIASKTTRLSISCYRPSQKPVGRSRSIQSQQLQCDSHEFNEMMAVSDIKIQYWPTAGPSLVASSVARANKQMIDDPCRGPRPGLNRSNPSAFTSESAHHLLRGQLGSEGTRDQLIHVTPAPGQRDRRHEL